VTDAFDPAPGNWFRFETEIVYVAAVVADPPYAGGAERIPWAHCATLNIVGAGTESELRVIHVGLGPGRDAVFTDFLGHHALVPKRLLI
jgi:hypothetical protein